MPPCEWACLDGFGWAAAAYPDHPVKIIAPFTAGGPTDLVARILADKLSREPRSSNSMSKTTPAPAAISAWRRSRAPTPDGYTILVASSSYVVNPSLYANNPYDPFKDFAPITLAAASPNILVVHPSVPAKTVKELIALLKANPGKYSIANSGLGTTPQLAAELFKLTFQARRRQRAVNGGAPAIQSRVAGQTPIGFAALPPAAPQVSAALCAALAVTSAKRSAALPDVPTMAEAGVAGQESETMQGVFVPAGTPTNIVDLLNKEIVKAMAHARCQRNALQLGFDIVADTPAEFSVYIKKEIDKWRKVIADAKIAQIQ